MNYFVYDNANRRIKVGNYNFLFEVVESVGGAWRGVIQISGEDPNELAAIRTLSTTIGVREIEEAEYKELLKKKTHSVKPSPQLIKTPQFHEGDREAAAVVVVARGSQPTRAETKPQDSVKIDTLLKVGKAPFVDPLEIKPVSKRKAKPVL